MEKKTLWVTDPWEKLIHEKETTLRWIEEGCLLGETHYWCDVNSIKILNEKSNLKAARVLSVQKGHGKNGFNFEKTNLFSPKDFDQIHYRVDPPVDSHYLHPLQILALETRNTKTEFVNPLDVLFLANEKFENFLLGNLTPPTLIATKLEDFLDFWKKNIKVVIKPIYDARGRGIELLDFKNSNDQSKFKEILKKLTHQFTSPALMQSYLDGIQKGEVRLWFLDGELMEKFRKFPFENDFKVNVTGGSRIEKTDLLPVETEAVKTISRLLKTRKIRLAAVDLIQGKCTDFNFTSPGLMVQMETLFSKNFSKIVMKKLS